MNRDEIAKFYGIPDRPIEIDPNGEYAFAIKDIEKAKEFRKKYPNATITLYGIDMASGTDSTFSGDIQISGIKHED